MPTVQRGRHAPPANGHQGAPKGQIDLGPKQRIIVEAIQSDQAYLGNLHGQIRQIEEEISKVKERIAANRGKLDLIAELAADYGVADQEIAGSAASISGGENGVGDRAARSPTVRSSSPPEDR